MPNIVHTIGHSTRTFLELAALLQEADVDLLVDVRSVPRSRTNPQFNADVLPGSLSTEGIGYHYIRALGGRRHPRRDAGPSPNIYWQNASFRAYADYTATDEFRAGLDELCELAERHRCAIMCAEAVWWRCHRRIITDYLLARDIAVSHILGAGHIDPAKPTPGVRRLAGGTLTYPGPAAGPSDEGA